MAAMKRINTIDENLSRETVGVIGMTPPGRIPGGNPEIFLPA
jgi:hypothetical protein